MGIVAVASKTPIRVKKILVATDFSANSQRAADYAAALAKSAAAEIVLVHVIDSFPYSVTDTFTVIDHRRALHKTAGFLLESLRSDLADKGMRVKSRLVTGAAYEEILKAARREKADLIILGTHGRTGVQHLLLGSVAEKVVRLADRPVLTVPASRQTEASRYT
jgi:nucleotide-binding universal stress UspA family protein